MIRIPKVSFFASVFLVYLFITGCTDSDNLKGTVTDIDGNKYHTVTIGNQMWMLENLNTTKYRDGSIIPQVETDSEWPHVTSGACCNFNNDINYGKKYGKLYNWNAVSDKRNIAPEGWHVATDNDWTILSTFLGGEVVAGGKMKKTGTTDWLSPNTDATNLCGFSALPGALRFDSGMYFYESMYGVWWSSDSYDNDLAWARLTVYNSGQLRRHNQPKKYGYSVRCVKDSI